MTQSSTTCTAPVGTDSSVATLKDGADSADPDPSEEPTPDPDTRGHCEVTLELNTSDCDPPAAGWLESQLATIVGLAGVPEGRLAVAVVDDEQMAAMHQQFCNQPGTTDVLTFDLRELPEEPVEGDLVICMDEARRQARQRGHDTRLELLLYAVHGLMHLLGEDDHDEAGYQQMHKREDELLTRAGLGPVFGL